MSKYRKEVLAIFKQLHRTRLRLYEGDEPMLAKSYYKLNLEFRNRLHLKTDAEITEAIEVAKDVETIFRRNVVQAVLNDKGVYEIKITEHTEMLDNVMFDENAKLPTRRSSQCCKDPKKTK